MRKKCTMSNSSNRILPAGNVSQGGNWMANGYQCLYVKCQNELLNGKWPLELEKLMTYALAHGVKIKIFRLQFGIWALSAVDRQTVADTHLCIKTDGKTWLTMWSHVTWKGNNPKNKIRATFGSPEQRLALLSVSGRPLWGCYMVKIRHFMLRSLSLNNWTLSI